MFGSHHEDKHQNLLGCLHKGFVGVDRVGGHGEDSAVELLEVVDPLAEGGDGLSVDKVHGVEDENDILLSLVILQTDVANLSVDNGMGGKVWGRPRGLQYLCFNIRSLSIRELRVFLSILVQQKERD